jgi:2-keto-4-pentenoate hydratase/2-oxohepta-3-ene-1,7-dioic acid hydratase in catechol pathway
MWRDENELGLKLLSLGRRGAERPALLLDSGKALDLTRVGPSFFSGWQQLLAGGFLAEARRIQAAGDWPAAALVDPAHEGWAPPIADPGKIICLGRNYQAHADEQGVAAPEAPLLFPKVNTALIGHGAPIVLPDPALEDRVDYEAELAVVIGRRAQRVSEAEAMACVAGYTILNDVTGRRTQRAEKQWLRAKGFDSFGPCGPWIVTADGIPDPHSLAIECRVNGELRQSSDTGRMIFRIPYLIAYLSRTMTLEPGDIISTGTPGGVGEHREPPVFLKAGDVVSCSVEGIGTLTNPVQAAG